MCGFLFYHSFDKSCFDQDALQAALDTLSVRGPDELCAFAIDQYGSLHKYRSIQEIRSLLSFSSITTFALHARLAITGESNIHSRQPYYDAQLDQIMLFNGEIYNFKELAAKYFPLDKDALVSDTHLLALLIKEFGDQAFDLIDGIYSILLYNLNSRTLSAFKDPLGVKPLYYFISDSTVVVGSTLKACVSFSKISPKINRKVASIYLKSGRLTLDNSTIFVGYHKMPSGFKLYCNLGSTNVTPSLWPWFSYDTLFKSNTKIANIRKDSLISRSISSQIPSCPFALLLSAGIDSSVVALECSKYSLYEVHSYTGKSNNIHDDESGIAAHISSVLGFQHQTVFPSADDFEPLIDKYIYSSLALLPSFSHLLELFIYRAINVSGFKVVLAGHGADELFSGYTKTDPILCFIDSLLSFRLKLALRFLCNYPTSICSPYSVLVCLKVVFSCYLSVVTHLLKYPRIRLSFFNKVKLLLSPLLTVRFSYLFLDSQLQSQLEPTDLASMFYSLECRIPLVSLSLMKEFFASVPAESSPGSLKFPLRTILQNDRRTAFLAKSFVKRGFQFAYVPALHGPFMDSMSDYSLRQLCLNKLLSMLK